MNDDKHAPTPPETETTTEGAATPEAKKKSPVKLILFIAIPVLLIAIIAGVLFLTAWGKHLIGLDSKEAVAEVTLPKHLQYYDLPEMLVNIQTDSLRKPYLRLVVKLEIHEPEDIKTLDLVKPRIIDAFQVFLRELRVEDLQGSAGTQHLKEELLKRVRLVAAPAKISDVLFGTFVVQ